MAFGFFLLDKHGGVEAALKTAPKSRLIGHKERILIDDDVEYCTMTVRDGDCLSVIARRLDISIGVLQKANQIANVEFLQAGQALKIPRRCRMPDRTGVATKGQGIFALLRPEDPRAAAPVRRVVANWGDSLWSLADEHGVSVQQLCQANGLSQECSLVVGQELCIPARVPLKRHRFSPPATPRLPTVRLPQFTLPPLHHILDHPRELHKMLLTHPVMSMVCREEFGHPVKGGWLSSHYGWKDNRPYFHEGIDIAVETGSNVYAARSGRVTYSNWKGGYGKTVQIDHGSGLSTLYAHCDALHVKPGQFVQKGDCIALSGSTGHSTGPHLHFEVRKHGKTVDPTDQIPPVPELC